MSTENVKMPPLYFQSSPAGYFYAETTDEKGFFKVYNDRWDAVGTILNRFFHPGGGRSYSGMELLALAGLLENIGSGFPLSKDRL
jgi:hypothetical protein